MPIDFLSFAYAATVAGGGIVGYTKAGKVHLKSGSPVCSHTFLSLF
jgi:hypothetical protein